MSGNAPSGEALAEHMSNSACQAAAADVWTTQVTKSGTCGRRQFMHSNWWSHSAASHLVGLHVGLPKVRIEAAVAAGRQWEQVVEQGPQLLLAEPCSRQVLALHRLTAGSSLQEAGPNHAESTGSKQGLHIAAFRWRLTRDGFAQKG